MKKLINYYVSEEQTIKEAISVIQSNLSRCVIVSNEAGKVIGVFSEGDVLRAILNDVNIHTPLKKVVKPSFFYLNKVDMQKACKLIKKEGITLIPVVDKDFKLKDVITVFDMLEHLELINGKVHQYRS